jgi:hypothetical protein
MHSVAFYCVLLDMGGNRDGLEAPFPSLQTTGAILPKPAIHIDIGLGRVMGYHRTATLLCMA